MNISAYLHPERLLIAAWKLDESIPMLHEYKQFKPDAALMPDAFAGHSVQIVLHRSDVVLHWYPFDPSEDAQERRDFESAAWTENLGTNTNIVIRTSTKLIKPDCVWSPSVQAKAHIAERLESLMELNPTFLLDIDLDIQAALTCTSPQPQSWLLLGRRGLLWTASLINERHDVVAYAEYEHDTDYSSEAMISLICHSVRDRYQVDVLRIMLLGDFLTADHITELKQRDSIRDFNIARFQPFRKIGSTLESSVAERLLRNAHVVSPLAGAMLQRFAFHEHEGA